MMRLSRAATFAVSFFAIALLWHGMFLPFSRSAYTDGILQIECFRYGMTFWPPLYAVMTRLFSWIPGVGLEAGGRIVSFLAGALAVFPLCALARRLFGMRAAFWAMAAWLASPMAMRWSLQVMTDMPMTALWTAALAGVVLAVEQVLPGMFPPAEPAIAPDARKANQWLLLATVAAVLASITRHQGALLFPLTCIAAWQLQKISRALASRTWNPWLSQLAWLIVPFTYLRGGMGAIQNHFAQIGERAAADRGAAYMLINVYWNNFESFVCLAPYFFSFGIFAFFIFGLLRVNWATARLRWAGWASFYLIAAIVILQSVFSSFQERYLLPLAPLVCLYAGHGLATLERRTEKQWLRFWSLAGPALALGFIFSGFVGTLQGSPFLDLKRAALHVRGMNLPVDQRVLANEFYNDRMRQPFKASFWSGIELDQFAMLQTTSPRPGDILVVSSYFEGSIAGYHQRMEMLQSNPGIELVAKFDHTLLPLLPDLMPEPHLVFSTMPSRPSSLNQNPVAWNLRYQPVHFQTAVLRVKTGQFDEALQTPIDPKPQINPELIEKLKQTEQELQRLKSEEEKQ